MLHFTHVDYFEVDKANHLHIDDFISFALVAIPHFAFKATV